MFQFQYNMQKKRVFIAVNLPEDLKDDLEAILGKARTLFGPAAPDEPSPDSPSQRGGRASPTGREVRFLTRDNWHLTISFLAYQDDHSISLITRAIEDTVRAFGPPAIDFEKIVYGPIGKPSRMIWLTGAKETSEILSEIKSFLEKKLFENGVRFRQEQRQFNAHVTLARFEAIKRSALPHLEMDFKRSFEAESLDLMESHLKRSGAEYAPFGKFVFKQKSV